MKEGATTFHEGPGAKKRSSNVNDRHVYCKKRRWIGKLKETTVTKTGGSMQIPSVFASSAKACRNYRSYLNRADEMVIDQI